MMKRSDAKSLLCGLVMVIMVIESRAATLSPEIGLLLVSPNEAAQWTEMDLNRTPPLSPHQLYSREEEKCFEERKMYFEGKCWELQKRGPCPDGQWLVLDPNSDGIKAVCSVRLCKSDSAYWQPTSECILLKDRTKCTKKETRLQVDNLGYGSCKCLSGAARAMAQNGACYQLYSRGLCDPGYVVGLDTTADEFPAICVRDKCNSTSPYTVLLPYNGSCYEEGSHIPCSDGETLTVDVHSGLPTCAHDLITWHIVNPPPRCSHIDHNGDCRNKLTVKHETDNYLLDLRQDKAKQKNKQKFGVSKG